MKLFCTILLYAFIAPTFCFAFNVDQLTVEEKVGQLLLVHFNGEEANEDAKFLVQELHVGGFIYYNWANGLHSPDQVRRLSTGLQQLAADIPLLIAVDQEGGKVARLTEGFTLFPGNQALGITQDPDLAEASAYIMGKEIHDVGINLNFAPVVDINNNPKNPIIGTRSFGETPEIVIPFAKRALDGFHRARIMTTLKHFPGHGDVEIDSHEDLPVLRKSVEELESFELLPYFALANESEMVMTAHIVVPALDPDNCATLSKACLDLLRNKIGFNGVIISDSLIMDGLIKDCASIDDAAVRAICAGCDMLILGGKQLVGARFGFELTSKDVHRIHGSLVDAVRIGVISEESLNAAVERVLLLKECYFD